MFAEAAHHLSSFQLVHVHVQQVGSKNKEETNHSSSRQ